MLTGLEPVPVLQSNLGIMNKGNEGMLLLHVTLDWNFDRFRWFALGLGNRAETPERDPFWFNEFMDLDDFTAAA